MRIISIIVKPLGKISRKFALSENRLLKNFSNTYVSLILYYQSGNFLLNCFWYVGIEALVRHFNKNTFLKSRAEKNEGKFIYDRIIIKNNNEQISQSADITFQNQQP